MDSILSSKSEPIFQWEDPRHTALPSAEEMRSFDQAQISSGTSALKLMELAGKAVTSQVIGLIKKERIKSPIIILCGPGNNGGDGLVVARLLNAKKVKIVVLAAKTERYSIEFEEQKKLFPKINWIDSGSDLKKFVPKTKTIFVDSLLGTGQKNAPRGVIAEMINWLTNHAALGHVLSVDIPSGVNSDTGEVYPIAVKANTTICIQFIKRGLLQYPARRNAGELIVSPIGIEPKLLPQFSLLNLSNLKKLPHRSPNAHKGVYGTVTVIGGSMGMPGASVLAANAAIRSGAGRVIRAHGVNWPSYQSMPEVMLLAIPTQNHFFDRVDLNNLKAGCDRSRVVVLGPGLGLENTTREITREILSHCAKKKISVVVDADALTHLSAFKKIPDLSLAVLTPHPGEAGKLLGVSSREIEADRYAAALAIHKKYQTTVVLKGAGSVVVDVDSAKGTVISLGNPYMATAGSGDVLSGIIAALLSQGMTQWNAACSGTYIHARAGDIAYEKNKGPIVASDMISELPRLIGGLTRD